MNLPYVYELLAAADHERNGFIKLIGSEADQEVRLMARAGLVEASFNDGREGSCTSIDRISPAGQSFLRAFKDHPIPDEATVAETFTASQAMLVDKWKSNFDAGLPNLRVVLE
jgi:hypothetical protein